MSTLMRGRPTQEPPQPERSSVGEVPGQNRWLVAIIVGLSLAVVGVSAWALSLHGRADDKSEELAAAEVQLKEVESELAAATSVVVLGDASLSERQQEMVDVAFQWIDAYRARDGDLVASYATDDAYVDYSSSNYMTLRVDDGTLQARVDNTNHETVVPFDWSLVYNNTVVLAGTWATGLDWLYVLEFTPVGEVKVEHGTVVFP